MNSNLNQLSINERIRLVEDLWDSIASDQNSISITSEQKTELDKRLGAYEATKDQGKQLDEVISAIRERL